MGKHWFAAALGISVLCTAPTAAFAWGQATHAYIADHSGKGAGLRNYAEIYGAMAPDTFNSDFALVRAPAALACIRSGTHGYPLPLAAPDEGFLDVWDQAGSGLVQNAAYGFVGHNDVWGADSFAHWRTSGGGTPGYIVAKAELLVAAIEAQKDALGKSPWDYLGIPPNPSPGPDPLADPARLISHFILEQAGDVLIKRRDPGIGLKMVSAALLRPNAFRDLMVAKLAPCLSAPEVTRAEATFRTETIARGLVMQGSESQILTALTALLVIQSPPFLEAVTGHPLDPALLPLVQQVLSGALQSGLTLIEPDFMPEVTTVAGGLDAALAANGVAY